MKKGKKNFIKNSVKGITIEQYIPLILDFRLQTDFCAQLPISGVYIMQNTLLCGLRFCKGKIISR